MVHRPRVVVRLSVKGFVSGDVGLEADNCKVLVNIEQQSPDIAHGVHDHFTKPPEEIGAGDQGHLFVYATDETTELMPLSHALDKRTSTPKRLNEKITKSFSDRNSGATSSGNSANLKRNASDSEGLGARLLKKRMTFLITPTQESRQR
ncbi:hypothetical protein ACFE04_027409 [Oxalis oulophora]